MFVSFWSPGTLLFLGFALQIVPSFVAFYRIRGRGDVTMREEKISDVVGHAGEFLLASWLMAYAVANQPYLPTPYTYVLPGWALWAGFDLYAVASAINGWARLELGNNWIRGVGFHPDQTLTDTGFFRRVRNPMYTSYWLMALGLASTGELLTVGLAVIVATCYSLRIPGEEKMLREVLGFRYALYKAQTGRFFPRFRKPRKVRPKYRY